MVWWLMSYMALFKINSALFAQDNFYCMNASTGEEKLKE